MSKRSGDRLLVPVLIGCILAACGSPDPTQVAQQREATTTSGGDAYASSTTQTSTPTTAASSEAGPNTTTTTTPKAAASRTVTGDDEPWPVDGPDVVIFVDADPPPPGTRNPYHDEHGNLRQGVIRVRYVQRDVDAIRRAMKDAMSLTGDRAVELRLFRDVLVELTNVRESGPTGYDPSGYNSWERRSYYGDLRVGGSNGFGTVGFHEGWRQDGLHDTYVFFDGRRLGIDTLLEIESVGNISAIAERHYGGGGDD